MESRDHFSRYGSYPLDEIPGANKIIRQIPGIDRAFRAANPNFPANSTIVDAMNNMNICTSTDCSEIASDLLRIAGGEGEILRVIPGERGNLNVLEDGNVVKYYYHEVYTDRRYVYDPKLSSEAVPKGDWESMMRGMNPGVSIKPKKDGSDVLDDVFRNP